MKQLSSKAFTGCTHTSPASLLYLPGSGHIEQVRQQTPSLAEKGHSSKFFCTQYLAVKALAQDLRDCFHPFGCPRRWREDTHLIPSPGHPCHQLRIPEVRGTDGLSEPSLRNGPMLNRINKYSLSQAEKDKQKQKKTQCYYKQGLLSRRERDECPKRSCISKSVIKKQ